MDLEDLGRLDGQSEGAAGDNNTGDLHSHSHSVTAAVSSQAAINTTAEAGSVVTSNTAQLAIAAFPKLAHAPDLQAVVAAAAREGGGGGGGVGGVTRRVVVVGNTAHLVTIHPATASSVTNQPSAPASVPGSPVVSLPGQPGVAGQQVVADSLDLRVKEELLTVVTEPQSCEEPPGLAEPRDSSAAAEPTLEQLTATDNNNGTQSQNNPSSNTTTATMIDTTDFRMSEPTYQTLTSVNGRMTPPGYSHLQGHYATLTPLQPVTPGPLPPISSIPMGEKFGYAPIVTSSQSFTVMQNNGLAQISLAAPYSYEGKLGMSPPHPSPLYSQNNGLHSLQQPSPGARESDRMLRPTAGRLTGHDVAGPRR